MANKTKAPEIAKGKKPLWWQRLALEGQMEYLEEHPRSKMKPSIKKSKTPKEVNSAIDKQTEDIQDDLTQVVDKAEKDWPNKVASMSPKVAKAIEAQLKEAITSGDKDGEDEDDWMNSKSRKVIAAVMLASKIGLLTVGAGALLAVNPNYVFLMPMLAKKLWDAIPDGSLQTGLVLYMGHKMIKSMRSTIKSAKESPKELKDSVVEAEPTTVAKPAKKSTEVGHYSHYTDIIKTLGSIEKEKVQLAAEHIMHQTNPLNRLAASLYLLYKVENMVPTLSNLSMTCSSQGHLVLKPRIQRNLLDFKAIRDKLKTDIESLATMITPKGMYVFGDKLLSSLQSQLRKQKISYKKSAIFNAEKSNSLQVVHCYEFEISRGNVTLYVHPTELRYSIERSKGFTPNFLTKSSVSDMMSDLRLHLVEAA